MPFRATLPGPAGEPVLRWAAALAGLGDTLGRLGRAREAAAVHARGADDMGFWRRFNGSVGHRPVVQGAFLFPGGEAGGSADGGDVDDGGGDGATSTVSLPWWDPPVLPDPQHQYPAAAVRALAEGGRFAAMRVHRSGLVHVSARGGMPFLMQTSTIPPCASERNVRSRGSVDSLR